jgi:Xaa-Pro aminopeptidase
LKTVTEKRLEMLRRAMHDLEIDALMVSIEENRRYLSCFTGEDTQFDESAGALFISENQLLLATDSRFELQAKKEAPDFDVFVYKKGLAAEIGQVIKKMGIQRLGVESLRMSLHQHARILEQLARERCAVPLVPMENLVENLRVIKSEPEIQALKKALIIAENAFRVVRSQIEPGMTERHLAWLMEKEVRESGADGLSFPTIVASGGNAALPHAIPGERKIQETEPILFDWGARLEGYCADISRTICIGEPDQRFQEVYETVREAQQRALQNICAGMTGKQADAIARDYIEGTKYIGLFGHGLGHGTGLAVHERPRLSPLGDQLLLEGMVFTVEPGIYIPDWGGVRLENMAVIRENGVEVLNQLPV